MIFICLICFGQGIFAQEQPRGLKATLTVKVFEGHSVMMYERNLTELKTCTVAIFGNQSIGSCGTSIRNIDRSITFGDYSLSVHEGSSRHLIRLDLGLYARGYMGGGQDGPYIQFRQDLQVGQTQEILFNLGYASRTPEFAADFVLRTRLDKIEPCNFNDCY